MDLGRMDHETTTVTKLRYTKSGQIKRQIKIREDEKQERIGKNGKERVSVYTYEVDEPKDKNRESQHEKESNRDKIKDNGKQKKEEVE